jgi:hypothetical protein
VPADEADEFVTLLGSRELAAAADDRLLVHLLLRADSINRKWLHWRRLKVRDELYVISFKFICSCWEAESIITSEQQAGPEQR